ncbi:MAG: hypothetical protein DRQ48_05535 [Gammaproteobacteria bacterium]|nr:MAG: hypothetical protein DRQ48_05535 [Gammaproteobacteria bacterium]
MAQENLKDIKALNRSLIVPFIILAFSLMLVIVLAILSAKNLDQYARTSSKLLVNNTISHHQKNLGLLVTEYAFWNETIEMLVKKQDMEWGKENIGDYVPEKYGVAWIFALNPENKLIYSTNNAEINKIHPDKFSSGGLQTLIAKALDTDFDDPDYATGLIEFNNKLNIVAACAFAAYEPTDLETGKAHGVLIFAKELNTALLNEWSNDFQIKDMSLIHENSTDLYRLDETYENISLSTVDGSKIGKIVWTPDDAGRVFINKFMPWVIGAILVMCIIGFIFYRRLKIYGALAYENMLALGVNREKLTYQAHYDQLTNLPNRVLMIDRIKHEIANCVRNQTKAAILYIDLDDFKYVNDSMGHHIGDLLLVQVAKRLTENIRENDTVSRFGGDEFCMLLNNIANANDAEIIASKIHQSFNLPFLIDGKDIVVGTSIGIVIIPENGKEHTALLRYADIAMYRAKSLGRNNYHFYTEELNLQSKRRSELKALLYSAIERDEFYLDYQPIYSLKNKKIISVEALLRWKSKELGNIAPMNFIPIAEDCGLISPIGEWVFERALHDIKYLYETTNEKIKLAVNVSARQFRKSDFFDSLMKVVDRYSIDPSMVQLEITENILISDHETGVDTLFKLADEGFEIVIDDFGTGYSSLSYIRRYPIKTLKIDMSFIQDVEKEERAKILVETIVDMARNFTMSTVAEGIETVEQENIIASTGCTYGQGNYFSKPEDIDIICEMILKNPDGN